MHVKIIIIFPNKNNVGVNMWNHFTNPEVRIKAPKAPVKGQGLWSTIWKVWFLLISINEGILL
jgi:hypothetical protein